MIANKIKPKVKKVIDKFPTYVDIYRDVKNEFGEYVESKLVELVQVNFEKEFILNTNDNAQLEKNQILLNCLENKDNSVRVIFSVDKLNEGWDVLNLFDKIIDATTNNMNTINIMNAFLYVVDI